MSAPPNASDSAARPSILGKRKASVKAREVISSFVGKNDKNDDDNLDLYDISDREKAKPPKKRIKVEPHAKPAATFSKPKGVYIGTVKKGNDNLPVRAEQYANGTVNYRVYRDDISAEAADRQTQFLATKRQVLMDDIVYDPALFHSGDGVPNIQGLTDQGKRQRVKAYLSTVAANQPAPTPLVPSKSPIQPTSTKSGGSPTIISAAQPASSSEPLDKPSPAAPSMSTPPTLTQPQQVNSQNPIAEQSIPSTLRKSPRKTSSKKNGKVEDSKDTVIGTWKYHPLVEVYAFLKTYAAPGARKKQRKREMMTLATMACFRIHPREVDEDTQQFEEFPKKTETVRFADIDFDPKFLKETESATVAFIKATLEARRQVRKQQHNSDDADSVYSPDAVDVEEAYVAATLAKKNRLGGKEALGQGVTTRRSARNKESTGFEEDDDSGHESEVLDFADDVNGKKAKDPKDEEIKRLTKVNTAQEQKIALLEDQLLQMQGKDYVPTTSLGARMVGNRVYDLIGSGPNAGKLQTKTWKKIRIAGVDYKEWVVLSEVRLDMGNKGEMTEVRQIWAEDCHRIPDGKNGGKWISGDVIYETPEGKFLKWVLREEIKGDEEFIL